MDSVCDPALEDCKVTIPDMLYAAYQDLNDYHWDSIIVKAIETEGAWQGLIWYFLAPLGAGALPAAFHFLYRNTTYFDAVDAVTAYYKYAWWTLWIGNIATNGVSWIFELIATFGGITMINMGVWYVAQAVLGVLHFMTVVALYIVSLDAIRTNGTLSAWFNHISLEMTTYIAIFAW